MERLRVWPFLLLTGFHILPPSYVLRDCFGIFVSVCTYDIKKEAPEFLEPALWAGYRSCLGVDDPPEDLLNTLLISLPGQELIDQHRVLVFNG